MRVIWGYWILDEYVRGLCFSFLKFFFWFLILVLYKVILNLFINEKCIGEYVVYYDFIICWDIWLCCLLIILKICNNFFFLVFLYGGYEIVKGVVYVNWNYFFFWIRKYLVFWL